ncbi:MAG: hypothetical protein LBF37_02085 [Rickettsiales bacterium]|jgi:hypothetical protein|nr:hypothetical protein [Rickettsiales bacterium]
MDKAQFEMLFDEIKDVIVFRCPDGQDAADLIHIAEFVVAKRISVISAEPKSVELLWTWLESAPTKILARFFLENHKNKKIDLAGDISALSGEINHVFKKGAAGAQIFIPVSSLDAFVNELLLVRDGLFFNKDLVLGMDLHEINASDWGSLFKNLNKIRVDALLLYLSNNKKGLVDFVGRIYGLLENLDFEFSGELHFMLGDDFGKMEQVWRLVHKMRPEIAPRLRFFTGN